MHYLSLSAVVYPLLADHSQAYSTNYGAVYLENQSLHPIPSMSYDKVAGLFTLPICMIVC